MIGFTLWYISQEIILMFSYALFWPFISSTLIFNRVGHILKKYTSGKIPRAVKIIPLLENWEDVLFLTKPSEWSTQVSILISFLFFYGSSLNILLIQKAMCALTKIFSVNFSEKNAQQYYNLVLLPTIKAGILFIFFSCTFSFHHRHELIHLQRVS